MPIYVKTISFNTTGKFNPKKDDPKVNAVLDKLRDNGATIKDIQVSLGGMTTATYLITYEASYPIK